MDNHEFSRRDVLRVAGATVLGAAALKLGENSAQAQAKLPPQSAQIPDRPVARPMPKLEEAPALPRDQRVGFAVVGLGQFAVNQILPNFEDSKKAKLVALVSGDAQKAARLGKQYNLAPGNLYNYENFDSIAGNPEIKVVYVIVPNSLHRGFVERAARAQKHVLCEKPLAATATDARAMIAACKAANVKLMTAYRAQYEPFNLKCIELAQSGQFGKIVSISSDHGRPIDLENPADQWRIKKEIAGGGPLPDIGIYSLNACRYLTGEEPIEVSAMLTQPKNNPKFAEVEQALVWTMRFPSGVLANCSTAYDYQETKRYRVFCENGWIDLDPATDYYKHRLTIEKKQPKGSQPESLKEELPLQEGNQFANVLDHMSECVLENKTPKTPGEEGLRDLVLIEAIYRAAKTGTPQKV